MAQTEEVGCTHSSLTLVKKAASETQSQFMFNCDGCKEVGFDVCNKCTTPGCNYRLHKDCTNPSFTMCHQFFGEREFVFQREPTPFSSRGLWNLCVACANRVNGWTYVHHEVADDEENHSTFVHPHCINLPPAMSLGGGTVVVLKEKLESIDCHLCFSKALAEWTPGWAYVASDGESGIHVRCLNGLAAES